MEMFHLLLHQIPLFLQTHALVENKSVKHRIILLVFPLKSLQQAQVLYMLNTCVSFQANICCRHTAKGDMARHAAE